MPERDRASAALLEELGWLTIQWARLEAYIDLLTAYLHHHDPTQEIPRPFNSRLRFIRKSLSQPILLNVRADGLRLIDDALSAARRRNTVVHGIVVQWEAGGGAHNTVLKSTPQGYVAIQDLRVEVQDVRDLAEEIRKISARGFGVLERIKSVFRLFGGEEDFHQVARLEGDRD